MNEKILHLTLKKKWFDMIASGEKKEIRKIKLRTDIIKDVYPHILRHTWATLALKSGVPLDTIQAILGHSKITTTQIYAAEDSSKIEYECRRFLN